MGAKSNIATFTRPADTTAYAANDLVANSTTAGDVDALALSWGDNFATWSSNVTTGVWG